MTESEADMTSSRGQGLLNINLECNPQIGDRGAGAIGNLISTQNAFSNNLKMVNLNECGITDTGYELLT